MKVLLASGVVKASNAAAGLCDHDAFLQKPYHEQQVVDRINMLLATRKPETDA